MLIKKLFFFSFGVVKNNIKKLAMIVLKIFIIKYFKKRRMRNLKASMIN